MQCQDEMRKPWFSISWGTTANTNNKPNGNVFALPCFELFHRWPAILDVILPGWQLLQVFNSRVVQYRHFVKQSWYTKFQPKSNQFGVDMLDDAKILRISKTLGRIFQRSNYESSPAKSSSFFLNEKDLRCLHHSSTSATSPKTRVSSSSSQGESLYRDQSCQYLLESQVGCAV